MGIVFFAHTVHMKKCERDKWHPSNEKKNIRQFSCVEVAFSMKFRSFYWLIILSVLYE